MGCVHSQKVAPTLPALLTNKSSGTGAGKGGKRLLSVTTKDEPITVDDAGAVAFPEDNNPEVPSAGGDCMHESSAAVLKEREEVPVVIPPTPPVETLKSFGASASKESMQSFTSSHSGSSAATNFTFGHRYSPMPTPTRSNVGSMSKLLALQEETPWAPSVSARTLGEHLADIPECSDIPEYSMATHMSPDWHCMAPYMAPDASDDSDYIARDTSDNLPEDPMAPVGRAVEKTVHALVDAGEHVWGRAQAVWVARYLMLGLKEPGMETDSDAEENELETTRQKVACL